MFSDNVSLQNEKLISASKSGDAKTVVSLLNSGADVQTKDKVYIYIYIYISIFFSYLSSIFTLALICMFICAVL